MTDWPIHAQSDGSIVIIGFGSIGKGFLPLLQRHIKHQPQQVTVIDPHSRHEAFLNAQGIQLIKAALTPENYRTILTPLLADKANSAVVNLSVDVSSVALIGLCQELKATYIDTVAEPWLGHYSDPDLTPAERSNYALRENVLAYRRKHPGGSTAVNCCGANPGMVSWLVKQAMLNLAQDSGVAVTTPQNRAGWATLAQTLGIKGIHIAERDTQRAQKPKPMNKFVNTWSVEGFIAEGLQPAELGWGTHEKALPVEGRSHKDGCGAAIYLMRPGAGTRVRSWTPTAQAQHGFLITHNEAISIADYFTVREGEKVVYRPTCHYAYRPADDAVISLDEMAGNQWQAQPDWHILEEDEILDGMDELGVLLYGHAKNAYWYGSQLTIEQARQLAPYQNATGLQVTSAVLAGLVWALENPDRGVVEADEMDFKRCLDIQTPYLGHVAGFYTDWNPLVNRAALFPEELDHSDPWQFSNILVR